MDNKPCLTICLTRHKGYRTNLESGWLRSLEGQPFQYHSFHPEAGNALLLRARAGMNSIRWQRGRNGDEYMLLCAISGSKEGGHWFTLSAEGIPLLSFASSSPNEPPFGRIEYLSNAEIRFDHVFTDDYGDHHGYLYLKLPAIDSQGKDAINLSLEAGDEDADDWFLLYEYEFSKYPRALWEPVLLEAEPEPLQAVKVVYDNVFGACGIDLDTGGQTLHFDTSAQHVVTSRIGIPMLPEPYSLPVNYLVDGLPDSYATLDIHPTTPRCVHILPFSHNDIGYTDLQENVRQRQIDNIRTAIREKESTAKLPTEAQARWNLEVIWALESWWNEAPREEWDSFLDAVRSGHIGLNALHNNLLSGLCSRDELHRHLDLARRFTSHTGIGIDTAAITDIPGFVWALVEALQAAGVRFLALAPNSGDRVGHFYKMADKPFWWESPDGKARVLTWIFGGGYAMFHRERLSTTGAKKLLGYVAKLQDSGYPYPMVPLAYTIGGDNGTPDTSLPQYVADWNARFASPKLVISTHKQFFHTFLDAHAAGIPVLKGDFTPYWEDGAASTALETRLARNAADRILQTETLYRVFRPQSYPKELLDEAWRKVIFWDEHTWGAWNSVSEPDSEFVTRQWEFKRQFALDADALSQKLLSGFLRKEAKSVEPGSFFVYNTLPHPVEALVALQGWDSHTDRIFLDEQGNTLPRQILHDGRMAVWVAFSGGYERRKIRYTHGGGLPVAEAPAEMHILTSPFMILEADARSCSVRSLRSSSNGTELLGGNDGLARYYYMRGNDREHLESVSGGRIVFCGSGEICSELLMEGCAPGCESYSVLFRLYKHIPRMDIQVCMNKLPVREAESVHLAFPFFMPDANLRYDGAGVLISPEADQLPGANRNFFCPEGMVDISNADGGVSVCLIDSPLIEIGNVTAELPWLESIEASTRFYAYLMNNYWHTNYKADQSGKVCFRFAVFLHDALGDENVLRFSRQAREAVIAGE